MADAFTTVLNALSAKVGTVAGLAVVVEPSDPVPLEDLPAVAIWPGAFDLREQVVGSDSWTWQFALTLTLRADSSAALAGLRHAKLAELMATLLADPTLGGVASDVRWLGGEQPANVDEGSYATEIDLAVEVDFATPERDPTSLL